MKEFLVPLNKEDLSKCSPSHYFVSSIYPVNSLKTKIADCRHALHSQGFLYIHAAFDYLFSALVHWPNVPPTLKEDVWALVLKGCVRTCQEFAGILEDNNYDSREKFKSRNAIKKSVYLLCQTMEVLFTDLSEVGPAIKGKGKGKKKKTEVSNVASLKLDLLSESLQTLQTLSELLKMPFEKIWDPPSLEEDFINCFANCCYKLMEDANIAKSVEHRNYMTDILHCLIRRHGYGPTCSAKLCQQLQCCPHLPSCIMAIVNGLLEKDKANVNVVQSLLKEICSFSGDELERDSQVAKNFAQFLPEFSSQHPHLIVGILPFLRNRLDEDPVTMRNCALTIIGEVILKVYNPKIKSNNSLAVESENSLTHEKDVLQRDKLLDLLQDHIHDINGLVRAKTLSVWFHIVDAQSLPMARLSSLVDLLVGPMGAIMDTCSQVRKHAIRVLTLMICKNATGRLSYEQLRESYEAEKKRLEDMESKQDPKFLELEKNWPNVILKIHKALSKIATDENEETERIDDDATAAQVVQQIHELLHSEEYVRAIQLFGLAQDAFPNDPLFCDIRATVNDDIESSSAGEEALLHRKMVIWLMKLEDIYIAVPKSESDMPNTQKQLESHQELENERKVVRFLYESMRFAEMVQLAIPSVKMLLGSACISDILEAIEFFVLGHLEGINNMDVGVKQMLSLIWSKEKAVREAVVEGFKRVYLTNAANLISIASNEHNLSEKDKQQQFCAHIFKSLSNLMNEAILGDVTSLEEVLCALLETDDLPIQDFAPYLLARFRRRIRGTTAYESLIAIVLISMISSKTHAVMNNLVDELIAEGLALGREDPFSRMSDASAFMSTSATTSQTRSLVNNDLRIVRFTCITLQKIFATKSNKNAPNRFPSHHLIFTRLSSILRKTFSWCEDDEWIPMMEAVINTIYSLSEHPDLICRDVILALSKQLFNDDKENPICIDLVNTPRMGSQFSSQSTQNDMNNGFSIILMARFIALGGHVAIKQLVHLDVAIKNELKRRHEILEKKNDENLKKDAVNETKQSNASHVTKKSRSRIADVDAGDADETTNKQQNNLDEDMGLAGANADDTESEFIQRLCEQGLVIEVDDVEMERRQQAALNGSDTSMTNGQTDNCNSPTMLVAPLSAASSRSQRLLCVMADLTCKVCEDVSLTEYPGLQSAASLALAKHMLVSSIFCEQRITLLLTLAERSPHEVVRANLIVALGDLCRRFPNQMDPWTPNIYSRLRDESARVRVNALNTLSHLILNDMIKVKGQISEMIICIVDKDKRISQLSKMFFQELSQKGNAFYNVLPDIISRLSDDKYGVEEDKFRLINEYIFRFIQKDKVCEGLVEKLCQRLKDSTSHRLWKYLSYCMTVLTFNDKMVQILFEGLRYFVHTMHVEEVYNNYMTVLNNCSKTIKGSAVDTLKDLETQIKNAHEKGVSDEEAMQNAKKAANLAKQRMLANKRLNSSRQSQQRTSQILEEIHETNDANNNDDDDDSRLEATQSTTTRSRRTRGEKNSSAPAAKSKRSKRRVNSWSSSEEEVE